MSNVIDMEEARRRLRPWEYDCCEEEFGVLFFDELPTPAHLRSLIESLRILMDPDEKDGK
jgi:hypothetical protein